MKRKPKPRNRHHGGESGRWPEISLLDTRQRSVRLNRPFGSAPYNPTDWDKHRIIKSCIKIRDAERLMAERDGRDWLGLGPRQYAYRLKAAGFLFADQTELGKDDFASVQKILVRMRRDPDIDFAFEDTSDGRGIEHVPAAYADNTERIETLAIWAERMPHDRMEGQKVVPELWIETEGLYNLVYDLADQYGARARALQGQSSITARYKLAKRVMQRWKQGVRTRILCVSDFDKHGDHILRAVAADTAEHLRDMGLPVDQECILRVTRVALTERQIREHDIPTAEKEGRPVQEAEALPTDVLRDEIEAALGDTLNMALFKRVARQKQGEIDDLVQRIECLHEDEEEEGGAQ
jgi:hypothetical protein